MLLGPRALLLLLLLLLLAACGEGSLPPGWSTHFDQATGRSYYAHSGTGEVTWEAPAPLSKEEAAATVSSAAPPRLSKMMG